MAPTVPRTQGIRESSPDDGNGARHSPASEESPAPDDGTCNVVGSDQFFWRAAKNPRDILRQQTPLSYPSNKTAKREDYVKRKLRAGIS